MDRELQQLAFSGESHHNEETLKLFNDWTFEHLVNDEGALMKLGSWNAEWDCSCYYYCGRELGIERIPDSDGHCGPKDGPQCASCYRTQQKVRPVDDTGVFMQLGERHSEIDLITARAQGYQQLKLACLRRAS